MKNTHQIILIAVLLLLSASPARTTEHSNIANRMFLIAGTPEKHTPLRFPTVLYGIDKNLSLQRLRPITTTDQGSEFIRPYYDDGLVVVGNVSQSGFFQIDYIDMNNVMREKSYEIPLCKGCSYTRSYHLAKKGQNFHLVNAVKSLGDNKVEVSLYGLNYDTGTVAEMTNADIDYARVFGSSSGNFNGDQIQWLQSFDNKPTYYGNAIAALSWQFPSNYQTTQHEKFDQSVNNNQIRIFSPFKLINKNENKGQEFVHYVFDKNTNRWSSFPLKNVTWLRAFGQWIVTEEQYLGFAQQSELEKLNGDRQEGKISYTPYRHYLARFKSWDIRKTGLLHLINPIKNVFIQIKTSKPDSEIILVEDDLVVYRVEDQIFTATIAGDKVINKQFLLKHDMVPAIHWAFMGKK